MKQIQEGQLVKEKNGLRWGQVVRVLDDGKRVEVHIKNGPKLEHNPVYGEYQLEAYKEGKK